MANPQNIVKHKFKKGETGNPNGRPKKIPTIDKLLSDVDESDYEAVMKALVKKAKAGDIRAIEVLYDRAYGKSKQEIKLNQVPTKQIMIIGGREIEF